MTLTCLGINPSGIGREFRAIEALNEPALYPTAEARWRVRQLYVTVINDKFLFH